MQICSLASGSSGNATYVASDRTALLIDCGAAARDIVARLASIGVHPGQVAGILITHAHSDHYRSAGTMHARFGIPIYVDPTTAREIDRRGAWTSWRRLREVQPIPERIGDLEIEAIDTRHGGPETDGRTVAYAVRAGRKRVCVVTDTGTVTEAMAARMRGADAILLEANYDEATVARKLSDPSHAGDWHYLGWVAGEWGHLSNRQAAEAIAGVATASTRHIFLGHMSVNHQDARQDNNAPELAEGELRRLLRAERVPLPTIHRTYRIGREPTGPSVRIEI